MLSMKVESITPKLAKKYLEANTENFRNLCHSTVTQMARDMANGLWELNAETIKFDSNGVLLDGQHRLSAVIKADVAVEMLVVRGLSCSAKHVDRGRQRKIGQWLAHEGIANAAAISRMAKLCILYDQGRWNVANFNNYQFSDDAIINFATENNARLQTALACARPAKRLATETLLASICYLGCRDEDVRSNETTTWFSQRIGDGVGLSSTDAVLHLRQCISEENPKRKPNAFMQRMMLTIAWNYTALGLDCTRSKLWIRLTGPTKTKLPNEIEIAD